MWIIDLLAYAGRTSPSGTQGLHAESSLPGILHSVKTVQRFNVRLLQKELERQESGKH